MTFKFWVLLCDPPIRLFNLPFNNRYYAMIDTYFDWLVIFSKPISIPFFASTVSLAKRLLRKDRVFPWLCFILQIKLPIMLNLALQAIRNLVGPLQGFSFPVKLILLDSTFKLVLLDLTFNLILLFFYHHYPFERFPFYLKFATLRDF